MKTFHAERIFRGKNITVDVTATDGGVQTGLFGGDKPHIGAVGIVNPAGKIMVTQFETHKEGVLCQQWCEELASAGCIPAVVSAGIHYDNASKEEIVQIVRLCNELLKDMLDNL